MCRLLCHISASEVCLFFFCFFDAFIEMKENHISIPKNIDELSWVASHYNAVSLPGACGSMDVVHIKWSTYPTGNYNHAKDKEGYPTLGFQCTIDYNQRVIAIHGPKFCTRNKKDIVKHDPNVMEIHDGWLRDCHWKYYAEDSTVNVHKGMYLICDNRCLQLPTSICPCTHVGAVTTEGYFSVNLESVPKDVKCS